eukprot:6465790-Prymnesium_polylepis.1
MLAVGHSICGLLSFGVLHHDSRDIDQVEVGVGWRYHAQDQHPSCGHAQPGLAGLVGAFFLLLGNLWPVPYLRADFFDDPALQESGNIGRRVFQIVWTRDQPEILAKSFPRSADQIVADKALNVLSM